MVLVVLLYVILAGYPPFFGEFLDTRFSSKSHIAGMTMRNGIGYARKPLNSMLTVDSLQCISLEKPSHIPCSTEITISQFDSKCLYAFRQIKYYRAPKKLKTRL